MSALTSDLNILRSPSTRRRRVNIPCLTQPMPPRLRSALQRSLLRPLDSTGVFYCPSCATWRRTLLTRVGANNAGIDKIVPVRRLTRPLASSPAISIRPFTTSSVITAGRTVPPRFKELYDALSGVQDAAIEQVSITRLQLALRGLESEAPLIRIAGECFPAKSFSTMATLLLARIHWG